ncbi:hypothetical protein [Kiloniella sp.]|uniref:hypothetical protein n=1 Tax=Kiloniella sp. TaxID=1938587 RepID=UPI003A8EE04F
MTNTKTDKFTSPITPEFILQIAYNHNQTYTNTKTLCAALQRSLQALSDDYGLIGVWATISWENGSIYFANNMFFHKILEINNSKIAVFYSPGGQKEYKPLSLPN